MTCVYVMNADSSGATPFTTTTGSTSDMDVDWSPDGKHLVFTRITDSESRIFVVDPDGNNLAQLTSVPSSMPRWSPDGERIAFKLQSATDAFAEIAVMNADGTGDRLLTTNVPPNHLYDDGPAWSHDGSLIAFSRVVLDPGGRPTSGKFYTIRPDGTGLTVVSPGPEALYDAGWRPRVEPLTAGAP